MKALKWTVIVIAVMAAIGVLAYQVLLKQTKQYSPEETVTWSDGTTEIEIFYNRPYKKGRQIFGGLVPYGEVWRTGANEATTFSTSRNIMVAGKPLGAGKYTLWTIPERGSWTVIFNTGSYGWGVSWGGVASRNPDLDALQVKVPAYLSSSVYEQFTITIEENPLRMRMVWDNTVVDVPLGE
jgi:hypothetical protein